ncbi:hypothetical protein VYU27_010110, partial [Nannochloropsis oceanica]
MPGVVSVLSASDVQGENDITAGVGDEFLLVPEGGTVQCVGQPLLLVLAESMEQARTAARAVLVEYEPVRDEEGKEVFPVLSCEEAIERKSFLPAGMVKELSSGGDIKEALADAKHRKSGRLSLGGQKHFYFETQTSLCIPEEGGTFAIHTSTQAPSDTHTVVAKVLGLPKHRLSIQARRAGGGFGGKLTRSFQNAAAAAVAARKTQRPVIMCNDRVDDFNLVGGREPMCFDYDVGFDDDGKVTALRWDMYMDGGAAADNSPGDNDMAILWAENTYHFPTYLANAYCLKTNLPVTTSMRAPGVVQSTVATELVLAEVARGLGKPLLDVQEINFYKDGDRTPYGQVIEGISSLTQVWARLKELARLEEKQAGVKAYNAQHRWRKRGVSMQPIKYGMPWGGI